MSSSTTTVAEPQAHEAAHDDHGHGHHDPTLAHHFDDHQQQFDSGKLGIWAFLVTEVLFFSGLFCAYSIWRAQHPEIFLYAHHYLDTFWGAFNTGVLLFSSLTAAWAVRSAQLENWTGVKINLIITILCAFGFMGVKYIEYSAKFAHGTGPGQFYEPHAAHMIVTEDNYKHLVGHAGAMAQERIAALYQDDPQAFAALEEEARVLAEEHAFEAEAEELGLSGASELTDGQRTAALAGWASEERHDWAHSGHGDHGHGDGHGDEAHGDGHGEGHDDHAHEAEAEAHGDGHDAHAAHGAHLHHPIDLEMEEIVAKQVLADHEQEPRAVKTFFGIYFGMTGLHGIHVLAGIIVLSWVLWRVQRKQITKNNFGAIDFSALYWHLVDLIWIYLFPLLYLIH
ncbi:MAG: cytochrome c oxidase subunit 3 [Planctomycetota bacterium]|jgi:cytochrome c oxidase subunit 3